MTVAALLADTVLVVHVGIVAFVAAGLVLTIAGGLLGWQWIRNRRFRFAHQGTIMFVALQSWLGHACPLTTWERWFRQAAGQPMYEGSFIEHWLSRLIFFDAPEWVFMTAYTAIAGIVVGAWWRYPPRPRRAAGYKRQADLPPCSSRS